MFVIPQTRPPEHRDYEPGIRIHLRFGPTEARLAGQDHVRAVLETDPTANRTFAFVLGCLIWGVTAWEGVGAPADGPGRKKVVLADLNPDNLAALLRQRPDIYEDLDRVFVGDVLRALNEKNGSSPSRNGISRRAGKGTAETSANGPAAPSAPTKRTPPKPRSASASGGSSRPAKGK